MTPRGWLWGVVVIAACTTETQSKAPATTPPSASPPPESTDPGTTPSQPPDAPDVSSETVAEVEAQPDAEPSHRSLKRLSVAQTRAAMEQHSGGVRWTDEAGNDLWEAYGATLGVADYQTRLHDNLDPSIMFQKFLDDAAVHTCDAWVANAAAEPVGTGSFFAAAAPDATDPSSVTANLVALRATLHGQTHAPTDPIIGNYATLFEVALRRTDDPVAAWTTVCVGFFTHPDFFLY